MCSWKDRTLRSTLQFAPIFLAFPVKHTNRHRSKLLTYASSFSHTGTSPPKFNRCAKPKVYHKHSIYKPFSRFEASLILQDPCQPLNNLRQSSVFDLWSALIAVSSLIIICSVAYNNFPLVNKDQGGKFLPKDIPPNYYTRRNSKMVGELLPGRPETLTPQEEEKLKELWATTFQVSGILDTNSSSSYTSQSNTNSENVSSKKPKKKRISLFRKNKDEEDESTADSSTNEINDKFGQMKVFNEALANMTPESLRTTFWSMVKHDNPDALLLRFLRARQWDTEKALVMMISTMRWRLTEVHVDDDIVKNGELKALEQSNGTDATEKKFGKDFLDQMRLGKSFLHGTDKNGRPLCMVRVRQHRQGEQSEESLERYTVYLIESARMVLASPVDTASVIFDMTGFSMANMDYTPVKFMIKCFEANYPECLGVVLVHKAPWVFQGIWKIIRGWLDPVVASKVNFTNTIEEMEEYVSRSHIIKELGGDEDWEYQYVEPVPGENDRMNDIETRDKLLHNREKIIKEYEAATRDWIRADSTESPAIYTRRQEIAKSLRDDYWNLDPYVRARSYYDRTGVLNPGGVVKFYPSLST